MFACILLQLYVFKNLCHSLTSLFTVVEMTVDDALKPAKWVVVSGTMQTWFTTPKKRARCLANSFHTDLI